MGQNQDKVEGGEQVLSKELEEERAGLDRGGVESHAGDVMEGESLCEDKTRNTGEKSDKPDSWDLDESPSGEPTTPSIEKHLHLCEREVRQGGAAGKEGGRGQGGGGGRISPLVPQETAKDQKSSSGIERLFDQIKTDKRKTTELLQSSSKIKMENQPEGTSPLKDENSGVSSSVDNSGKDFVMLKSNACGSHTGSELPLVQDLNEGIVTEAENEDFKLCAGTAGCSSERKEPSPGQPQHPMKNSLQKEVLLVMSDTIHCGALKESTENIFKEETLACEEKSASKVTEAADQKESVKPQMDTSETIKAMFPNSSFNVALAIEPSFILENLLRRNKKVATSPASKVKEPDSDSKDSTDVPVEMNGKGTPNCMASATDSDLNDQCGPDLQEPDMKWMFMAHNATSDVPIAQPAVMGHAMCDSSLMKSHETINSPVQADLEMKPNVAPSESVSTDSFQSAVSHERMSCEVSGVISVESTPSTVSQAESPPPKRGGQNADSSQVHLSAEKTDSSSQQLPPQRESDTDSKTSGSDTADTQSQRRLMVKDCSEEVASPTGDSGAVSGADGMVLTKESHQLSVTTKQDLQNVTLQKENALPDETDKKPCKERHDGVTMREKSDNTPKSRPVSELIKETIQLHEKLQHQDRPKPAEVKCDDQGQSVKVAQMKAAFDSAQKSPDKTIERKPSVRRGKVIYLSTLYSAQNQFLSSVSVYCNFTP